MGILLPYLVEGHLSDYPTRLHDLVVFVLGAASMGHPIGGRQSSLIDSVLAGATDMARKIGEGAAAVIKRRPAPVGSRVFYKSWEGVGPQTWRSVGETISPTAVWAATGLDPRSLGVGFNGSTELKGMIPSPTDEVALRPGRMEVRRTVEDPDLSAAAGAAEDLEDVE
jgi:hypothetical protein